MSATVASRTYRKLKRAANQWLKQDARNHRRGGDGRSAGVGNWSGLHTYAAGRCESGSLAGEASVRGGISPSALEFPSLTPVIHWLEGGCERRWAAKELRNLQARIGQVEAPQLAAAARRNLLVDASCVNGEEAGDELLANVARSRGKYPSNRRMFDGLMGKVTQLGRAYRGDGDIYAEALDVAACALRIAIEGDAGGNLHPMLVGDGAGTFSPAHAVGVADKVRKALAECYQDRLLGRSSQIGGNMDWARVEGASRVVAALRREFGLEETLQVATG
ncbi:hypothetical protein [Duganella vulcania]|uniref:Uncharacterized protein n=1 Tax=Duganella vulcania TaxID=2692166 RepID=A0A845GGH3_9BURK|nr:hypothetical protein [Duganella vulcania]MYM92485.1 hypothetical protein [Duganella vulcania]